MKRIAIVTQSYRKDFCECKLLCESIDRFAKDFDHFIFVNAEDVTLFQKLNYNRHYVRSKNEVLPWYMVRLPIKIMGHYFHISPFTIPVREWIIQQVCKLGVFEVLGDSYDAVLNVDSESILMRSLTCDFVYQNGKYVLYKSLNQCEPNYDEYCSAAKKLYGLNVELDELYKYNYMSTPVCFVRDNLEQALSRIKQNNLFNSWKLALFNTYRFSENFLYGIFNTFCIGEQSHFVCDRYLFPLIDIVEYNDEKKLRERIELLINDENIIGVLLQKTNRKQFSDRYIDTKIVESVVKQIWTKQ